MIKHLAIYIVAFAALFFAIHYSQVEILKLNATVVRFNLWDTNLFFAAASALICIHLKIFSKIEALKPQLGFIYLPTLFIKGGLFFFAFRSTVFSLETLTTAERLSLLLPVLIFLILEVFFVVQILKENEPEI